MHSLDSWHCLTLVSRGSWVFIYLLIFMDNTAGPVCRDTVKLVILRLNGFNLMFNLTAVQSENVPNVLKTPAGGLSLVHSPSVLLCSGAWLAFSPTTVGLAVVNTAHSQLRATWDFQGTAGSSCCQVDAVVVRSLTMLCWHSSDALFPWMGDIFHV